MHFSHSNLYLFMYTYKHSILLHSGNIYMVRVSKHSGSIVPWCFSICSFVFLEFPFSTLFLLNSIMLRGSVTSDLQCPYFLDFLNRSSFTACGYLHVNVVKMSFNSCTFNTISKTNLHGNYCLDSVFCSKI